MRLLPPIAMLLTACGSDAPGWAIDPIFLDPDGAGVRGTHTWQVYAEPWDRRFAERHYLCSALVVLRGEPSPADCEGCLVAFDVQPELADSDCPDALAADPRFVGLVRVGLTDVMDGGPYPGASSRGWADYGAGWEVHGRAWPDALSHGAEPASSTWNGVEPFALTPELVWPMSGGPALAPVSRSAPEPWPGSAR